MHGSAWYGILPAFRRRGYGTEVMLFTKEKATKKGFKHLRLYADDQANHISIKLFEKLNMTKEFYTKEKGKYYQVGNMLIFSWSLTDNKVLPWNNKYLNLTEELDLNEQSIEKLKRDNILELFTESTFMENLRVPTKD